MPLLITQEHYSHGHMFIQPGDKDNHHIPTMHANIDPDASMEDFGVAPYYWADYTGNAYVNRLDRSPLDVDTVKAFSDFCQHHLSPYFCWTSVASNSKPGKTQEFKEQVLDQITPQNWAIYLQDWKKYKQQGITNDKDVNGRVDGKVSMGFDAETGGRLCRHLLCTHT